MTGPPYPALPGPAIGEFQIGTTPIGTPAAFNVWDTIISQYANSPALTTLLLNAFDALDQTSDLDEFFDRIWNVATAKGHGLDVWGDIVGVDRVLTLAAGGRFLGFQEQTGLTVDPFNVSPFFSGASVSNNFALTDDSFRTLIYAKALANISDCSIRGINAILRALFPNRGNCYVTDGRDMTMTYTFAFALSGVEAAIVTQSGVLPRPAAVLATVVQG